MALIAERILAQVQNKRIDPKNVIQFVKDVSKVASNKREAVEALKIIAKGVDGVSNTADDIIPPTTLKTIVMLMETGVLEDLVGELRTWRCPCFS